MRCLLAAFYFLLIIISCNAAYSNTDSLLTRLDEVLSRKEEITKKKLVRIQRLVEDVRFKNLTSLQRYFGYSAIFQEYKTINFDSSLTYANKVKAEALNLEDQGKANRANIDLAFILLSSGMFKETHEVLNSIDISSESNENQIEYYTLKARYFYDLCDFVKNGAYCLQYTAQGNRLADSALSLAIPGSYSYYFISGLKNLRSGKTERALDDYSRIINDKQISEHQYAIIASTLSFLYAQNNRKTEAFSFLIKAAIADVNAATKENVALLRLADTLFKSGDNERAYRYIKEAMADAEFYGARHRQFEVGSLLPIIEGKQLMLVEKQKNILSAYAAVVTILILIIISFIVIVIRQNKKLKLAQSSLAEANVSLNDTNEALKEVISALREANHIKDEYIGYYFNINSEYISKIERFKKSVSQRLEMGRIEDIKQIINKIDLKKEREDLSLSFDRVFIKLFPNFIGEFNALFAEEDRMKIPDKQILNTELRIFALIRLGIHDNDKIANILNFSVNTVYSYKTRVKNKSFIQNEEFENRIMQIKAD